MRKRPLWLWPMGLTAEWLVALPLALVLYANADPRQMVPEVQAWMEAAARPFPRTLWILALLILMGLAHWGSFLKERVRRPRATLFLLALPWSVVLSAWWIGVNQTSAGGIVGGVVLVLLVAIPPAVVFGCEMFAGRLALQHGMRRYEQDDMSLASRLLRLANLLRPGDPEVMKATGLAVYRLRDWEAAEQWLQSARRTLTDDTEMLWPLATMAVRREAWDEAVPLLEAHLERAPDDDAAWESLCNVHLALGQRSKAATACAKITVEEDIPSLEKLAELAFRCEDLDRTLAIAQRIRDLEGKPRRRFAALVERILEVQPEMIPALEAMAGLAEELGRAVELRRWRETILALRPDDVALRRHLMAQLRESGEALAIEKHLQVIVEQGTPTRDDLVEMVNLLNQRSAWDELRGILDQGKERFPEAWEFPLIDARMALEREDYDRCAEQCDQAAARATEPEEKRRVETVREKLQHIRSEGHVRELRERVATAADPLAVRWEIVEEMSRLHALDRIGAELDDILHRDPGQREQVGKVLDRLIEEHEKSSFALLGYLRDLHMREGNLDGVFATSERMAAQSLTPDSVMEETCERLLAQNPQHAPCLRWRTMRAHGSGDGPGTIEWLDQWFAVDSSAGESAENLQMLFDALCATDSLERGVEIARRLLAAHHDELANLRALARLYEQHEKVIEAHQCLLHAQQIDDQDHEIRDEIQRLDVAVRQARIEEIEARLKRDPDNAALQHELGDLHYSFEQYTEAIPHLQRAATDPTLANLCRAKIAHALALRGMLDLAHETLSGVVVEAEDPQHLETLKAIHYNVGEILREAGQSDRALEAFKRLFHADASYRNVVEKLETLSH